MTPQEKAEDLVKKYVQFRKDGRLMFFGLELSKQCALIAVNEIINGSRLFYIEDYDYWQGVKKEIEKL